MAVSHGCWIAQIFGRRWSCKYKVIFAILLVILAVQLYLGYYSTQLEPQRVDSKWILLPNEGAVDDEDLASNSNSYARQRDAREHTDHHEDAKKHRKSPFNDLSFDPVCDVKSRDAVSAVNRAHSVECKRQILDTVCAIESGEFYPHSLVSECPRGNHTAGRALGCFQDDQSKRLLSGYYVNNKGTNSVKKCIETCLQSGFMFAGVQYGTECFCGQSPPPSTALLAAGKCNMKCTASGDKTETCGGYFTMNVFETGISKFVPQTAELIPKLGEPQVKIVFLLTLNGRALRQVKRLIRSLYSPSHYFYIHVDSRQDYLFRELSPLETEFTNIKLTRRRFSTIWGGASLLQMLLSCMSELLALPDWHWDVVINLSESDFPLKRLDRLVDFLTANKGRNFVKSHGRETQRFVTKQGLDKTFVECDMHMWRVGDRQLPLGIQVDGGSDWVALDREFVEFIVSGLESGDSLLSGLMRIFQYTLLPAESFFHTTLRNSRFCDSYVDNNLHLTNWKRKLGCKCQYRHVVDWCGCSPNDFKAEDWARLEATEAKQLFFARKFEPIISQAALERLEQWILAGDEDLLAAAQVENLKSYWQSVYHHLDVPRQKSADDALLTVAHSLIRQSLVNDRVELLNTTKILEVTYLMNEDRFKGFLIRYSLNASMEFEFLAKGTQQVQTNKKSKFAQRISVLEVSTDFDQKEQRARNYAKVIGPNSEPTVLFQLRKTKSDLASPNMTALWVDPAGNLRDVTEIHIDDQVPNLIFFSKAVLATPLRPGMWTVKLVQRGGTGTLLALIKFLVVPLEFVDGAKVSAETAETVNRGTESDLNAGEWERFLAPRVEREELVRKGKENARRSGKELQQWIDQLVKSVFLIHSHCTVDRGVDKIAGEGRSTGNVVERCSETSWSSLAPDPKSEIRGLG